MQKIRSSCFHRYFTPSGSIDARLRAIMLSQLLTTIVVLTKMESMISVGHTGLLVCLVPSLLLRYTVFRSCIQFSMLLSSFLLLSYKSRRFLPSIPLM